MDLQVVAIVLPRKRWTREGVSNSKKFFKAKLSKTKVKWPDLPQGFTLTDKFGYF